LFEHGGIQIKGARLEPVHYKCVVAIPLKAVLVVAGGRLHAPEWDVDAVFDFCPNVERLTVASPAPRL